MNNELVSAGQELSKMFSEMVKSLPEETEEEAKAKALELERKLERENSARGYSLWRASGIPSRHEEFKPHESTSKEWNDQWFKVAQSIGSGVIVVILGTRGAGKTQMAVCAIREACKIGKSSKFTKALNFFLDIRNTYKKDSKYTEKDVLEEYCEKDLLVIDAIENRSDSAFENLLLNHLIDIRYDRCKDTILIANFTVDRFAESMGPSIVDRIHECGIKIVCDWKSFRRQ